LHLCKAGVTIPIMKYVVLLFYKYITIESPEAMRDSLKELGDKLGLTGRILIAREGINATVEGADEKIELFVKEILSYECFADIDIKRSEGTGSAFNKFKVKVRDEIVGTKFPKDIDPRNHTAPKLSPDELRDWYENDKDFVVIDMRNDYEFISGHFKNSVNPGLKHSRDLAEKVKDLEPYKDKTVVTVCTGGIRCEKMAAYLEHEGFRNVHQLDGGMHTYMEKYPGKDFKGTLFTFDNRLTMDFGGEREIVGECHHCSEKTERYESCHRKPCHKKMLLCEGCFEEGKVFCTQECAEVGMVVKG